MSAGRKSRTHGKLAFPAVDFVIRVLAQNGRSAEGASIGRKGGSTSLRFNVLWMWRAVLVAENARFFYNFLPPLFLFPSARYYRSVQIIIYKSMSALHHIARLV